MMAEAEAPDDDLLAEPTDEDEAPAAPRELIVDDGGAGRIDRYLAEKLGLPRSRLQRWIDQGRVELGGVAVAKSSLPLLPGQVLRIVPPAPVEERIEPEQGELAILYQDADLIAIDKAAGVAVHPGAGRPKGTLAHFLLHRFPELAGVGGQGRPGIVHRLDQGTTGVLLVARSDFAYGALQQLFARREIDKTYLALVHGQPKEKHGRVDLPIGRHPSERQKMAVRPSGRPAGTRWRLLAGHRFVSLLEFGLETGRTHQIRVHAKAIGHPLIGDPVYGENRRAAPPAAQRAIEAMGRPALHARRLVFRHPRSQERLMIEAPIPQDLLDLWQALTGSPWPAS